MKKKTKNWEEPVGLCSVDIDNSIFLIEIVNGDKVDPNIIHNIKLYYGEAKCEFHTKLKPGVYYFEIHCWFYDENDKSHDYGFEMLFENPKEIIITENHEYFNVI